MTLFVSPHNDDESLFGAFTLLREKPLVVIVYDGYIQWNRGLHVTAMERQYETIAAMKILGVDVEFLGFRDDSPLVNVCDIEEKLKAYKADEVYLPAFETCGNVQHNLVSRVLCSPKTHRYLTYTSLGKSISRNRVPIWDPKWIALKHRALACYESQMSLDPKMGCWPHFLRSMEEYYAD